MMDGKIVLLAAVIIVLIHSAKSTETSGPSEDPDKLLVDRLCRSKKVHLTTMAQYNSLFKPPSSSELLNTCPDNLKSIITHFQPATKLASEDACSMETVQAFKDYYVAFIMDKSKKAPRWWKQFVVAYGMQLSNLCKENALKVLTSTEALLREEDVARLGDWVSDTSPLRPILESMNEPGTFVLPTDFIALASRNASFVPEKMYIQSKETESLKLYKEVCQKRFQPVYERLMMPLAVLSGIGFYYMKEELLVEYENRENSAVHDKWTNILFVCEALKLVEPVEYLVSNGDGDDKDKDNDDEVAPLFGPLEKDDMELSSRYDEQPEPRSKPTKPKRKWWQLCWWCSKKKSVEMNDDGVIKLLTKEEAHAINQKYEELQRVQSLGYETDDASDVIEQFAPEFTKIQMKDLVLDKSDKKLVKTVKKFKRSKSKMRKVKGRLQRKALITLRRELKAGKVNVLASGAVVEKWESLKSKSRGEDVSKSIVRITEKMADQSIAHEKKWSKTKIIVFITVLILALAVLAVVFYVTGGAAALAIAFGVGLAHGIGRR